jgi:hypothetical protein
MRIKFSIKEISILPYKTLKETKKNQMDIVELFLSRVCDYTVTEDDYFFPVVSQVIQGDDIVEDMWYEIRKETDPEVFKFPQFMPLKLLETFLKSGQKQAFQHVNSTINITYEQKSAQLRSLGTIDEIYVKLTKKIS